MTMEEVNDMVWDLKHKVKTMKHKVDYLQTK